MIDRRDRDPRWVADELTKDNHEHRRVLWSGRFEMPTEQAVESVKAAFVACGASGARTDGASAQVVVEFDPMLTVRIAEVAVASGGILFSRLPRI